MKVVSGIMLTLLLISMLKLAFDIQLVKANPETITVPDDYPTIQEAINAAALGDTIYVHNGTYHENIVVNKTVSLVGENRSTTIIDGSNSSTVVYISANDVYVSGFTIRYSGLDFDDNGIRLDSSSNIVISGNVITNNTWDIWLEQASNNAISENIIANSSDSGIYLGASNNNVVNDNTITNNTYGMWLERSSTNNTIRNNIVTWNWMGISLAKTSDGNSVYENTITKNDEGIHLFSDFNSIYENTIENNWAGIYSLKSEENIIYRNNFINNTVQVDMGDSVGVWDNGAEGNYWSDYDGQDLNGDGIGDTLLPYQGLDQYPLVEAWSQFRLFPPVASFTGSSTSVFTAVVIHFNASASYDPDGYIMSYFWDFGDGTNATGVLVNHAYTSPGIYNVTLTVKDAANNTNTHSISVSVLSPPEVSSWWIIGAVALIAIGVVGIVLWKHKTRKNVT